MITYSWKSKDNKAGTNHSKAETLEEFKSFLHENKADIAFINADIDGKYWQFDLRGGWKELDHDPEDLPF